MTSASRDTIQSGDQIRVEIVLTNTSDQVFKDAVYLDSNNRKLFSGEQEGVYSVTRNAEKEEQRPLNYLVEGDFDYGFDLAKIAPNEKVTLRYLITANPTAFGKMGIGLLEKGESGDDIYGDISLSPDNMC